MKELKDINAKGLSHETVLLSVDLIADSVNRLNAAVWELQDEVDLLKNRLHKPLDMDRMIETATAAAKIFKEEPRYTPKQLEEE